MIGGARRHARVRARRGGDARRAGGRARRGRGAGGAGDRGALLRAVRTGKLGFEDLKRGRAVGAGRDRGGGGEGRARRDPGRRAGGSAGWRAACSARAGRGCRGGRRAGRWSPGGAYLVGERGPELFVPTRAGGSRRASAAARARCGWRSRSTRRRGEAPAALARSSRQVARAVRAALGGVTFGSRDDGPREARRRKRGSALSRERRNGDASFAACGWRATVRGLRFRRPAVASTGCADDRVVDRRRASAPICLVPGRSDMAYWLRPSATSRRRVHHAVRSAVLDGEFSAADDGGGDDDRAGCAAGRCGVLRRGRPGRADLGGGGPARSSAARATRRRAISRRAGCRSGGGRRACCRSMRSTGRC